jgi:hypothetical protein
VESIRARVVFWYAGSAMKTARLWSSSLLAIALTHSAISAADPPSVAAFRPTGAKAAAVASNARAAPQRPAGWKPLAEIRQTARQAGYEAVRRDFDTGKYVGSRTGESYPAASGRYWDSAHGVPTIAPKNPKAYAARIVIDSRPRFDALKKTLMLTRDGRAALGLQAKYKTKVQFFEGSGASYDPGTNTMSIGTENRERTPLSFVHEMNHADFIHTGKRVDVRVATREQYVAGMNHEESVGASKEGEAYREFRRKVPAMRGDDLRQTVDVYRRAYIAVVRDGRAARQGRSVAPAR